jgi:hypothetical protein
LPFREQRGAFRLLVSAPTSFGWVAGSRTSLCSAAGEVPPIGLAGGKRLGLPLSLGDLPLWTLFEQRALGIRESARGSRPGGDAPSEVSITQQLHATLEGMPERRTVAS